MCAAISQTEPSRAPRTKRSSRTAVLAALVALLAPAIMVGAPWIRVALVDRQPSRSIGRVGDGRLEHGKALPPWGPGYVTYSFLGASLGTQYAHGRLRETLLRTFSARAAAASDMRYVLGETAARGGGPFHGHRTHQNGLSVDVFMPIRDGAGRKTSLPTWPWNGLGYWWEFDARGSAGGYRIDFEELAAFLLELDRQARASGLDITRVIIAPEYVPLLLGSPTGSKLGALAGKLTRRPVWVRHDEHIHVDFTTLP
jgi:penicillin-insensitive murein endopeptidase